MPPMLMVHDEDPKEVIYKKIGMVKGKIPGFQLMGNRVLMAIYEMPEKTKSGLFIPDKSRDENLHQGKAALIVALGPTAFVSDERVHFNEEEILKVGDFVMGFVSHGLRCSINGYPCRIIRDQDITMKIPAPDAIW